MICAHDMLKFFLPPPITSQHHLSTPNEEESDDVVPVDDAAAADAKRQWQQSPSNTVWDISMGCGNGSDGGGMSVASAGSYEYMDEEDEEEAVNKLMSEIDRLSGRAISKSNEKSDDALVDGKMLEAAIKESVKALDKDVDIDVDAVQGKGKASVVGDQAADSVSILFNKWLCLLHMMMFVESHIISISFLYN